MTRETAIALIEYQCLNTNGPYRGISTLGAPQRLDWISGGVMEFSDSTSDRESDGEQCRDTNIRLIFWRNTDRGQNTSFHRPADLICIGQWNSAGTQNQPSRCKSMSEGSEIGGRNVPIAEVSGWNTWLLPIGQILGSDGKLQRPCGISGIWWHSMHGGATILTTMQIALLHCATLATVAAAATERVLANSRSWIFNGT